MRYVRIFAVLFICSLVVGCGVETGVRFSNESKYTVRNMAFTPDTGDPVRYDPELEAEGSTEYLEAAAGFYAPSYQYQSGANWITVVRTSTVELVVGDKVTYVIGEGPLEDYIIERKDIPLQP